MLKPFRPRADSRSVDLWQGIRRSTCAIAALALAFACTPAAAAPAKHRLSSASKHARDGWQRWRETRVEQRSGHLGVGKLSERRLRRFEADALGGAHAAEHARERAGMRRLKRKRKLRAVEPRKLRARTSALDSAAGGRWSAPFSLPVHAINTIALPTGKLLLFAYPNNPDTPAGPRDESHAWLWDPATNLFKQVDPPIDPATGKPVNIWCGGASLLADGRVLVTGGNLSYPTSGKGYAGLKHVYTFNPWNETWTRQPDMERGRWYPSQLLMPDGRTVIMQGFDETGTDVKNHDLEVFTPSSDLDGVGTIRKLGTLPVDLQGDYYPHMFWMPSGRGFIAGPWTTDSWFLRRPGDPPTFAYDDVDNSHRSRTWGTAVQVPGGSAGSTRVLQLGGSDTTAGLNLSVASSEQYDEANPGAGWTWGSSLKVARGHHNTVLLPDGSMVTVGGGVGSDPSRNGIWTANDAHRQVELWNPQTNSWTLGNAQAEFRTYHSTAVLLPDGRVFSGGDDINGGYSADSGELYEPPYLFKGERPTIAAAPAQVSVGATFSVDTPNTNVTKAALVAPGAATHAVDMNQRYLPLQVAQRSGGVTLTAPPTVDAAPPGWYMLFLVSDQGVPSVAKFVRLLPPGGAAPPPPPPTTDPEPELIMELAAGKPALASSQQSGYEAARALDRDTATRWKSARKTGEWWQVDLGTARPVDSVKLDWHSNGWASRYRISTSTDGSSFATAAEQSQTSAGVRSTSFSRREARYVRVSVLARGTTNASQIRESYVYGPAAAVQPPPPPAEEEPPPPAEEPAPPAEQPPPSGASVEKAQGQPATASSYEPAPWFEPRLGNDGDPATRWSSLFTNGEWWQVDLGRSRWVDRVVISWNEWAFATRWRISTSTDGTTWTTAIEGMQGEPPSTTTSTFAARQARFVRIAGLARGTLNGISFYEAKVYGVAD